MATAATASTTTIDCYFATVRLQKPGVDFFRTFDCAVIVAFTLYFDVCFIFICFRIRFLARLGKGYYVCVFVCWGPYQFTHRPICLITEVILLDY